MVDKDYGLFNGLNVPQGTNPNDALASGWQTNFVDPAAQRTFDHEPVAASEHRSSFMLAISVDNIPEPTSPPESV